LLLPADGAEARQDYPADARVCSSDVVNISFISAKGQMYLAHWRDKV
jgi:hypothetical protein